MDTIKSATVNTITKADDYLLYNLIHGYFSDKEIYGVVRYLNRDNQSV